MRGARCNSRRRGYGRGGTNSITDTLSYPWLAGWLVWMVPARIGGAPPRTRHRFLTFPHDGCYMYVYRQAAAVGALTSRPGTQPRNTAHASGERARVSIYVYVCARDRATC